MEEKPIASNVQGERTRAAILGAAIDLFGEKGFKGASLSMIAERADVFQSALHHHFGSKQKLLEAALERYFPTHVFGSRLERVRSGAASFGEAMIEAASDNFANPRRIRFFVILNGEALASDHPAHSYFIERYDQLRSEYAEAVTRAANISEPEGLARVAEVVSLFFAASDGLQMQWLRNPKLDLLGAIRMAADVADAGIQSLTEAEPGHR